MVNWQFAKGISQITHDLIRLLRRIHVVLRDSFCKVAPGLGTGRCVFGLGGEAGGGPLLEMSNIRHKGDAGTKATSISAGQ